MPRQRSPDSKKAETLYRKGMKLSEIADRLGVPAGTVRRWKADQKWDDAGRSGRSEKATRNVRKPSGKTEHNPSARKRGAPVGNVNAVGAGAPIGNKNAEIHGAYSKVLADVFTEEEKELAQFMFPDEESKLEEEITVCTIRERRIMKAINRYHAMVNPVTGEPIPLVVSGTMRSEHKRVFDGTEEERIAQEEEYKRIVEEKIDSGDRMPGRDITMTTNTENKDDIILRMERELTSVQSQKMKLINTLAQLKLEKQKIEGESKGNDFVRTWADSVLKARREQNGES